MRIIQEAPSDRFSVLESMCRTIQYPDVVVQIGATVEWPGALNERSAFANLSIGLLHLGPGCHEQLEYLTPYLTRGAIVLFEDAGPDSPAHSYAAGWAARGYLSSPVVARHWSDLAITTFFGGSK